MIDNALRRGANAVVGLRYDTSAPLGYSQVEIVAYGTAVIVKKDDGKDKGKGKDGGKNGKKGEKAEKEVGRRARAENAQALR